MQNTIVLDVAARWITIKLPLRRSVQHSAILLGKIVLNLQLTV
jgi:hypothetical protein